MRSVSNLLLFLLRSATVGLAVAFVVLFFYPQLLGDRGSPRSYASAVRATSASVVNIHSARRVAASQRDMADSSRRQRFEGARPGGNGGAAESTSLGSGVIVSTDGYVLTNEHVIRGADRIEVGLRDGRSAAAKVVGVDPDTDLALLKIDLLHLTPITLGRSDNLAVGDVVLAIGDPYGVGQTVTQGIVSATGRSQLGLSTFENFIQTDAAINPGNSGGALIDAQGRLVGINTAVYSPDGGFNGIGFAIPVNLARGVMQDLIKYGRVMRGWVGLDIQKLTPRLARAFHSPGLKGVVVKGVLRNGPGRSAGIKVGDVLTSIGGKAVVSSRDALNIIASLKPGTPISMTVSRWGKVFQVKMVVTERPVNVES
ncbi:MAG TPA: trypsin-like peptidase domain-containing protein [Gammaproteobacteria bacterium]|nr:trypsin-like peptidase domain-containing protein [Gammaproteobacteria bacterium]